MCRPALSNYSPLAVETAVLGWCGHGWSRDNAQPGVPSARWKVVQEAGRVGRDPSRHATFITVVEKKRLAKGHNL